MRRRCVGFTLVELLVVIAIIGLLVALLLPAIQAAREAGRRTQCGNQLKQLALGVLNYEGQYKKFPYGSSYLQPTKSGGWLAFTLPFIEQMSLYQRFDFSVHMSHPNNAQALNSVVPALLCPSDPQSSEPLLSGRCVCCTSGPIRSHITSYLGSMGPLPLENICFYCTPNTPSPNNPCCQGNSNGAGGVGPGVFTASQISSRAADIRDGLSNTILIGETLPRHSIHNTAFSAIFPLGVTNIPLNTMSGANWDGTAIDVNALTPLNQHSLSPIYQAQGFKSLHPGGAMVAMCDGSVQFLQANMEYRLLNARGTKSGAEAIGN